MNVALNCHPRGFLHTCTTRCQRWVQSLLITIWHDWHDYTMRGSEVLVMTRWARSRRECRGTPWGQLWTPDVLLAPALPGNNSHSIVAMWHDCFINNRVISEGLHNTSKSTNVNRDAQRVKTEKVLNAHRDTGNVLYRLFTDFILTSVHSSIPNADKIHS